MCRFLFLRNFNPCVTHCCHIKRLTDTIVTEQARRKKLVRCQIRKNRSVIDQHDTVHVSPEYILKAMFNDQNRRACFFLNFINQLDCLLAGCRIKVCQWLIKQKNFDLINHNTRKADPLLLSAGQLVRCIIQMVFNSDKLCGMTGDRMHFILRCATVFQGKSNVFTYCQSDKLSVRILQNRSHVGRQVKNTAVRCIHTIHGQRTFTFSRIGKRIQTINASCQCTLTTAGRSCDQHLFARINIQIDSCQCRLLLRPVLE